MDAFYIAGWWPGCDAKDPKPSGVGARVPDRRDAGTRESEVRRTQAERARLRAELGGARWMSQERLRQLAAERGLR